MSWSLGEMRSLSMKAARGCGLPWGLAEEAGFAVWWLEARCHPGVQALATYLNEIEGKETKSEHCPITLGATISDLGAWEDVFPTKVFQPLLMIPFLAAVAGSDTIELTGNGYTLFVRQPGLCGEIPERVLAQGTHAMRCGKCTSLDANLECTSRVPEDREPFVAELLTHATKTYAPASEASRLSGAGAGLSDND